MDRKGTELFMMKNKKECLNKFNCLSKKECLKLSILKDVIYQYLPPMPQKNIC